MRIGLALTAFMLLCSRSLALDIETKEDYLIFASRLSRGNSYKGKTIFLRSDIDLSGEEMIPMGIEMDDGTNSYFEGTFDGQGHTIRGLNITSSELAVGLFGYVQGGAVRNVVLGKSCTITVLNSDYSSRFIGGIAGTLFSEKSSIILQNSVSMASIYAYGVKGTPLIGGIAGFVAFDGYGVDVYNCMNLGNIYYELDSGSELDGSTFVGGIVGYLSGDTIAVTILNCLNLGKISVTSKISFFAGGIAGYVDDGYVANSVNLGELILGGGKSGYSSGMSGEVIGFFLIADIFNCYYKKSSLDFSAWGMDGAVDCGMFDSNYMLSDDITVGDYTGKSVVHLLNAFAKLFYFYESSEWLLNKNNKNIMLKLTKQAKAFETKAGIILLPKVADAGIYHFYGWYTDSDYNNIFTAHEIDEDVNIYGKYEIYDKNFTVSFDTNGTVEIEPITAKFGDVITLPQREVGDKRIGLWEFRLDGDSYGTADTEFTMLSYDVTLYAVWVSTVIRTPEDFKEFSDKVNYGISFAGLTVTLENDLDMSGISMKKIGGAGLSFKGVFEGNGNVISNLKITADLDIKQIGLFAYSITGMTVRNLILDESCTIKGNYQALSTFGINSFGVSTGGIIGYCLSEDTNCVLENSVNMGEVKFTGTTRDDEYLFVGGLVGYFKTINYPCRIMNSAFLGKVNSEGKSYATLAGGIIGIIIGDLDAGQGKIENSINSGTITFGSTPSESYIGGIVGSLEIDVIVQNCVNTGSFSTDNDENSTIGLIAGNMYNGAMQNCFWRKGDEKKFKSCGESSESSVGNSTNFDEIFGLGTAVSTGDYKGYSLILALNAYTLSSNDLSKWLINEEDMYTKTISNVTFEVDDRVIYETNSEVILLPSFVSHGNTHFFGWCTDPETSKLYTKNVVREDINLYGTWREARDKYTVTFMSEGKVIKKIDYAHGKKVVTSSVNPKKKGYEFIGWVDDYGRKVGKNYIMQTQDLTFTALWLKDKISTAEDLKEFSDAVDSGVDCDGKVIRIMNDIDMSGIKDFVPIGTRDSAFKGTFEGQGYRISNLEIKTTEQYSGFIGNTLDATIRNIVIDGSCSIVSNYTKGYGSVGGVVGYCGTENKKCTLINAVNFASVTYRCEKSYSAWTMNIGGVMGLCQGFANGCVINNCANYGPVTNEVSTDYTWIGGVIGKCGGSYEYSSCNLWNSVNYGAVTYNGETKDTNENFGAGGILGLCAENTNVGGCVSSGDIFIQHINSPQVGSITGKNRDLCTATENLWFWWLDYSDNGDKNPEINEDMHTLNGEYIVDLLNSYTNSRKMRKEGNVRSYKSTWVVNPSNKEITAKVNGRTIATYNSTVVLLPTFLDGNKYHFYGWKDGSSNIKSLEVSKDMTFTGEWEKEVDKTVVIGVSSGVAALVVLVIIIILVTLYLMKYLKWRKNRKMLKDLVYPKIYDKDVPENSLSRKEGYYTEDYIRHGDIQMREALKRAGLNDELTAKVMDSCYEKAHSLSDDDKLPKGVTVDDAAAISLYTFDFGNESLRKLNPYYLVNAALREKSDKELDKAKDLIYLILKALRKLPVVHGHEFYRGIPMNLNYGNKNQKQASKFLQIEDYKKGVQFTWDALTSTSPDMEVTEAFLASNTRAGQVSVLFNIQGGWGYDVQPFSLFPTEKEILMEPERQFEVTAVLKTNDSRVIKLDMLKTPILFPELFGTHDLDTSSISYVKEKASNYSYELQLKKRKSQRFDATFKDNIDDWQQQDIDTDKGEFTAEKVDISNMKRREIEMEEVDEITD